MPEQPPSQVVPPSHFMTELMDMTFSCGACSGEILNSSISWVMKRDGGTTWLGLGRLWHGLWCLHLELVRVCCRPGGPYKVCRPSYSKSLPSEAHLLELSSAAAALCTSATRPCWPCW